MRQHQHAVPAAGKVKCKHPSLVSLLLHLAPAAVTLTAQENQLIVVSRGGLSMVDGDDSFADLEFPADDLTNGMQNPLLLLSAAAKQLNPRQFELPKDIMCPVTFPGLYCAYKICNCY
jgi:hypothetical protein